MLGVLLLAMCSFISGCAAKYSVEAHSEPEGAVIEVDNEFVGKAPCTFELKGHKMLIPGFGLMTGLGDSHTVTATLPGYEVQVKPLYQDQDPPKKMLFSMGVVKNPIKIEEHLKIDHNVNTNTPSQ